MNYYERHIGDYLKDTAHLSLLEHGVYTRLLDVYYTREGGIPDGEAARLVGARSKEEREALTAVLREFFVLSDGIHSQTRADREVARFQDKQRKAKASADKRWSQTERNANADADVSPNAMRTHTEGNAPRARPQTPDPRHQPPNPRQPPPDGTTSTKPRTVADSPRGSRLPEGWEPDEELLAWAAAEHPDVDLDACLANFRDYWRGVSGKAGVKADWPATFRNAVRSERAPRKRVNGRATAPPDVWWSSNEGIDRKGRELGLTARGGETYSAYRERINAKLRGEVAHAS